MIYELNINSGDIIFQSLEKDKIWDRIIEYLAKNGLNGGETISISTLNKGISCYPLDDNEDPW